MRISTTSSVERYVAFGLVPALVGIAYVTVLFSTVVGSVNRSSYDITVGREPMGLSLDGLADLNARTLSIRRPSILPPEAGCSGATVFLLLQRTLLGDDYLHLA